jgi:hypothetical protein
VARGLEGRKIIIIRTAASLIGTEGSGRGRARTCCEARVSLRVSTAAAGNPRGTAR